jgi:tetratricopeptide (TPR) repeat protein
MWGYDAWGHVAYVLFLDVFRGLPWPDQGWSYFHPPLYYALGWVLLQARDAELLVRGLALWSSAASLAIAALAAWLVRRASPEHPLLAPLAFGAIAYLPAHLLLSPMPGNEMTLTLLSCAGLCLFIANECRERPRLVVDAAVGGLAGLALLTKFSGLLPVLSTGVALALRAAIERRGFSRAALRAGVIAGVALVVAAPYYQRNIAVFGTPFQLSRDYPLVSRVEARQRPGTREASDYLRFPLGVFTDPEPQAAHMLGSVWGTVYANVWADVFRESDVERAVEAHASAGFMAVLGLLPTALFAAGAWLAFVDLRRGRRRAVYLPLLVHAAAVLAAFVVFSWRVPIWSSLKSSYLLGLSLPFAVFLARGVEQTLSADRGVRKGLGLWLAATAGAAALLGTEGLVLPRRGDAPATAAVRFHLGDPAGAREVYARLAAGAARPVPWLDGLAAIELAEGRPGAARDLYARALAGEPRRRWNRNYRRGQLAVAMALAADRESAARELDAALAARELPELRANRGALHAAAGDPARAEVDLRRALEVNPELVPARLNLAVVLETSGRPEQARRARAEAARLACTVPRRYPHGLGTGEVLEWGVGRRALLLLENGGLRLADTDFHRGACRALSGVR